MAKIEHIQKVQSVDDLLAEHLQKAEDHLIAAVKLFEKSNRPVRVSQYKVRLIRAQEIVTSLMGEELIRIRGPIKTRRKKK